MFATLFQHLKQIKMKKQILKTIMLLLFSHLATAQKGQQKFYVDLNLGYNFLGAATSIGYIQSAPNATTNIRENKVLSLGKGISLGANFGYKFNSFIGAELGVNYLMGSENKYTSSNFTGSFDNGSTQVKMLQIMPKLVVSADFDKINPYAKLGLVIGSGNILQTRDLKTGGGISEEASKFDGNIAVGFTSSAGATYALGKNTSLFAELNFIDLSYNPTKRKLTKYIFNGEDILKNLTINDSETVYSDEYTYDSSVATNDNEPEKDTKKYFALSSFGLNMGLRYAF